MDLSDSSIGLTSPVTTRFRALVTYFISPTQEVKLVSYHTGEAQLTLERAGKPPVFIVLIDAAREDERGLRVRLVKLASESVHNQHVVFVANHAWMPTALKKAADEFYPKMALYQLSADGDIEAKPRSTLPALMAALRAQKDFPTRTETEQEFADRCAHAEREKQRLAEVYNDTLKHRPAAATFGLLITAAVLFGLGRLWLPASDSLTVLVQLGARVTPLVRDGEWWRMLASSALHSGPIHLALSLLVLLSIGHQTEKLMGTARFLTIYVASALVGAVASMLLTPSALSSIRVGSSGALCGVLGACLVLCVHPVGLPVDIVQRLRKITGVGLLMCAGITALPGVDRISHAGGLVTGVALVATGAVRPLRVGWTPSAVREIAQMILGALCGLLFWGSVGLSIWHGRPWQPDTSWKKRVGLAAVRGTAADPGSAGAGTGTAHRPELDGDLTPVRHTIAETGVTLALPTLLGEGKLTSEPGRTPVVEFGDLGEKMQKLEVVVLLHKKPLKKKAMILAAFDQSVAQVRADKLKEGKLIGEPTRDDTLDFPVFEMSTQVQESVRSRGVIQARRRGVVVLWYTYSELLPDHLQIDLKRVLGSLDDGEDESAGGKKAKKAKKAKGKRKR